MEYKQILVNYLNEGYSLVPVSDSFIPKISEWQNKKQVFESNLNNWKDIKKWGIITGKLSNNLEVIDFDEKYKKGIFDLWVSKLSPELKKVLSTLPISKSKNNGFHVHYTCKTIEGNLKLAKRKEDGKATIETRGEGGFIFEYPTEGYKYIQLSSSFIKEITPEQRDIFLNTARELTEIKEIKEIETEIKEIPKIYRNFNLNIKWEDILIPQGWTILNTKNNETFWRRPGKDEKSTSATTNYKGKDLLHIFSSSTPFKPEKSYNKFQVYTFYNYNNNYKLSIESLKVKKEGDFISFKQSSSVTSKPVDWLWKDKIAKGKVTMIAGDPGIGKSQLSLYLAGIVSAGGLFPGGYKCEKGGVFLFSAEDDIEDTINPRLQAVESDREHIYIFSCVQLKDKEKSFEIGEDIQLLEKALNEIKNISLIIIDPITAFLGEGIDSYKNSDVRALLSILSKTASKYKVAVVVISHLNKGSGTSIMNKISGSLAFVAAARAVFMVIKDQNDEDRRLFLPVKNNLAIDKGGYAYKIENVSISNDINASRVKWEEEAVTMTLSDALKEEGGIVDNKTVNWLTSFLKDYPIGVSFDKIIIAAQKAGISKRTIYRAEKDVFIDKIYQGKNMPKIWKLIDFEV